MVFSTASLFNCGKWCAAVLLPVALTHLHVPISFIGFSKFPMDPVLQVKKVNQVRRILAQWDTTEHSVLWSEHFTEDCFKENATLAHSFGISKPRRFKEGAIPSWECAIPSWDCTFSRILWGFPTIFERRCAERASTSNKRPCNPDVLSAMPKCLYRDVEKRDRFRISNCTCCCSSK